jgi:chemotaxis protein histidine kinase CheA
MAEKVEIDIEVNSNVGESIADLKELKKQLKLTAAGSEDFKKLYNQIDDLEDKIKSAKQGSSDWVDSLESAGGPLGSLGKGLNAAKVATVSFGTALKATGIGLIVAAVGGLVAAFTQSETAMKKLQPLFIAFEKILGGIFKAFEPVLDAFIELATQALPYITKGIGMFYSGLYSLFTLVKNVGVSAGQLLKGIFTLDFDALKEGAAGIKDAFNGISKTFEETYKRFEEGTNEQTKTEKENAEERAKNAKEARDKAAAAAEKLRQENLKKAEAANAVELEAFKATLTDREKAELDAGIRLAEQRKILADAGRTDMTAIEEQYRITLAEIKKKADDEEAKVKEEKDKKDAESLKKKLEEERGIILTNLQSKFEDLDRENARVDFDFQADLERLRAQKDILAQQEATELQNLELTEFQKTEIRKKYADARKGITDQEIATEKSAAEAKQAINMAYLGLFEQFGNVLGQVAGKNKALAIAGIVISQAAAIGQIIAQTSIANAKSVAASPLTFGMPWVAINTISAGLSIASTIASAVKSIQGINQAASSAGVTGGGGGQVMAAPTLPKVAGMAAPQIQTQGGQSSSSQIAQTLAMAQSNPTRAYVVSSEITSNQALDRRTNRAATFSGG